MIRSQLIQRMAQQQPHIPEKDIALSVNLILETLSDALAHGERIEIRDFGSFSLHYRPPRNAHNPKTGVKVITTAKYCPHFKPGKALRERVDTSREQFPIVREESDDA